MPSRPLRIGTRGSAMALHQAGLARDRLKAAHPDLAPEGAVELVPIRTTGDRVLTRRLSEISGKGLFTREIEEALLFWSGLGKTGCRPLNTRHLR